jgi:uncharacterized protein (DUF433 family)
LIIRIQYAKIETVKRDLKRIKGGTMTIEAVMDRHITITPGVAGGKPHIVGHRITVQNIVIWHERMGLSADEIATEYNLTLADIYAALAYYYDHQAEIDKAIREDEAFVEALRQVTPSKLPEKLRDRIFIK